MRTLTINVDLLAKTDQGLVLEKELEQFIIKLHNATIDGKYIGGIYHLNQCTPAP